MLSLWMVLSADVDNYNQRIQAGNYLSPRQFLQDIECCIDAHNVGQHPTVCMRLIFLRLYKPNVVESSEFSEVSFSRLASICTPEIDQYQWSFSVCDVLTA